MMRIHWIILGYNYYVEQSGLNLVEGFFVVLPLCDSSGNTGVIAFTPGLFMPPGPPLKKFIRGHSTPAPPPTCVCPS